MSHLLVFLNNSAVVSILNEGLLSRSLWKKKAALLLLQEAGVCRGG